MRGDVHRESPRNAAESQTLGMCGNSMRENRETPEAPVPGTDPALVAVAGRSEKADGRTSDMHVSGESDGPIVPTKRANNAERSVAESVEGRGPTKGNARRTVHAPDAEPGKCGIGLRGVREAAKRDKAMRFTALLHHVTPELLRQSYLVLKRTAAPGVDGVTWEEYGRGLEGRLVDLHGRVQRGTYRAQPSKRAWIPGNHEALDQFHTQVVRLWLHVLRRRSQKGRRWAWERMRRLIRRWLPRATIVHPYPDARLIVNIPKVRAV